MLNYRWQEEVVQCSSRPSCYWVLIHTYRTACCDVWQCILCPVLAQRDNIWGPFLIISPASTLNNWHQEFTRFVPKFKVRIHPQSCARNRRHLHHITSAGIYFLTTALPGPFHFSKEPSAACRLCEILSNIWDCQNDSLGGGVVSEHSQLQLCLGENQPISLSAKDHLSKTSVLAMLSYTTQVCIQVCPFSPLLWK